MITNRQLLTFLFVIPGILLATTIHEFTRALTSTLLGDNKPKDDGRLTLNPFKHFEPIGFILMFATGGFGWGKPVETRALYYKNRKRDTLITAIAPTVANFIFAVLFMFLFKHVGLRINNLWISLLLQSCVTFNISLTVYNLIPISPMDGLKVLSCIMPANQYFKYLQYEKMVQMIFLLLLFMQYTDIIISPIISFVTLFIDLITF